VTTTPKPCWYKCVPFDLDAPLYGPSAVHPIFEYKPSELPTLAQYLANAETSWVGDQMRSSAAWWHSVDKDTGSYGWDFALNTGGEMIGSILDMTANMTSAEAMYTGAQRIKHRADLVMQGELEAGSNPVWATAQMVSSVAGDVVGYNNILEASFNVDRETMTAVGGATERWSLGLAGAGQVLLTGAGGLGKVWDVELRIPTAVTRFNARAASKIEALARVNRALLEKMGGGVSKALKAAEQCLEPSMAKGAWMIPDALKRTIRNAKSGFARAIQNMPRPYWDFGRLNSFPGAAFPSWKRAAKTGERVYVHYDEAGKINYIGITEDLEVRAGQHRLDPSKTGETMKPITDALTHDQARTIEGMLIRQRLQEARSKGLITGREPIEEQLQKAGLLNKNRGRDVSRWIEDLDPDDFIKEFDEIFDIKTPDGR
jgi:hypothetical protein